MSTTRLVRETNPPDGKTASPVPQYKHTSTGEYEDVLGQNGHAFFGALTSRIVDLKSLLDNVGEVQASPTSNTLLDRLKTLATDLTAMQVQIGNTDAAVVNAGAVGSLSAKLRRLTTDLDAANTLLTSIAGKDFSTETTLVAIGVLQTAANALLTTIAGKDFATQTTLAALLVNSDAVIASETYGDGAPGAHAGEPAGYSYMDVTDGDIYVSTGAAWVLKLEGIWDL